MLVRDVMSTGVLTVRADDAVRDVVIRMLSRHCGAIPVVEDDDVLVGLVAVRDVLLPLYPNFGDYIHDSVGSRDFVAMESAYAALLAISALLVRRGENTDAKLAARAQSGEPH